MRTSTELTIRCFPTELRSPRQCEEFAVVLNGTYVRRWSNGVLGLVRDGNSPYLYSQHSITPILHSALWHLTFVALACRQRGALSSFLRVEPRARADELLANAFGRLISFPVCASLAMLPSIEVTKLKVSQKRAFFLTRGVFATTHLEFSSSFADRIEIAHSLT